MRTILKLGTYFIFFYLFIIHLFFRVLFFYFRYISTKCNTKSDFYQNFPSIRKMAMVKKSLYDQKGKLKPIINLVAFYLFFWPFYLKLCFCVQFGKADQKVAGSLFKIFKDYDFNLNFPNLVSLL